MSLGTNLKPSLKNYILTWHFHFTSYYYYPTKTGLVQLTKDLERVVYS